jgi:hypothetical protein
MTSSPETGNQPSRLRKSGLSRTVLAGALVACASPAIAHATVIYSGPIDQTATQGSPVTLSLSGTDVLQFLIGGKGKDTDDAVYVFLDGAVVAESGSLDELPPGFSVDVGTANWVYGTGYLGVPVSSTPFYIGFDSNPTDKVGATTFGYAEVTSTADSITLLDYAYEQDPIVAIEIPAATPEPSSLALLFTGIAGIGSVIRRRRIVR